MGAESFITSSRGETAEEAFNEAVREALYECGHSGYTGSIAEKTDFVEIPLPNGADPMTEADRLLDDGDGRVTNKWGPAGCFNLGKGRFLFFGLASS
jgi:hypothetical protein